MYEQAGAAARAPGGTGTEFGANGGGEAPAGEDTVEGEFREVGSDH